MTASAPPAGASPPRRTPLHDVHVAAGARMVDFAGWSMPLSYGSDLAEHRAVRQAAGLFDLSHMGLITVAGAQAPAALDHALAGRLSALEVRRSKYTMLLAPDGGVLDDLIVTRLPGADADAPPRFAVVANAGNRFAVAAALRERLAGYDAAVTGTGESTAILAVQGPAAPAVLEALHGLVVDDGAPGLRELGYYRTTSALFEGVAVLLARTGYTGEDGFELFLDGAAAPRLWTALLDAGRPAGLVPCGLAARDTLRLEAGMPLHGHELTAGLLPAQAGLGRVVDEGKPHFVGRGATPSPGAPVLVGLSSEGRRAGRAGYPVLHDGREVGVVTSGALSPTLGHPIAMALVDPSFAAPGTVLAISLRGTLLPATVTSLPFLRKARR